RCRAHRLRHVQERGKGNLHRFVTTGAKVGWQKRALGALELHAPEPRERSVMQRFACVVVVLLLLLPAALAPVRESVTVEVLEVPVYITTTDGKPIRGLAKDAFELFVDGKRQTIDYFEAVDFA